MYIPVREQYNGCVGNVADCNLETELDPIKTTVLTLNDPKTMAKFAHRATHPARDAYAVEHFRGHNRWGHVVLAALGIGIMVLVAAAAVLSCR